MRIIDYDSPDKASANSDNHIATDEAMTKKFGNLQRAYNEGFAASDGVRPETAETDGGALHPESGDESHPRRKATLAEEENPGLADN